MFFQDLERFGVPAEVSETIIEPGNERIGSTTLICGAIYHQRVLYYGVTTTKFPIFDP